VIEKTMTLSAAVEQFGEAVRRAHDLNESTLVLENGQPLARIVPAQPQVCRAEDLATMWQSLPHLNVKEADDFAADIDKARAELLPITSKWE
jgi:antitoxin (DNA-binding transcriptional repressor) of toxin-antitoxin stability system